MVAASRPAPRAGATTAALADKVGFGSRAAGDAQAWATAAERLVLGDDDPGQAEEKKEGFSSHQSAARRSSRLHPYLRPERLERAPARGGRR